MGTFIFYFKYILMLIFGSFDIAALILLISDLCICLLLMVYS